MQILTMAHRLLGCVQSLQCQPKGSNFVTGLCVCFSANQNNHSYVGKVRKRYGADENIKSLFLPNSKLDLMSNS